MGTDPGDEAAWGFAPPPFQADAALMKIQRALRDARLTERSGGFELKGRRLVELERVDAQQIRVRLARKPALTPEWDRLEVHSAAELRKLLDEVKQRLARWQEDDS